MREVGKKRTYREPMGSYERTLNYCELNEIKGGLKKVIQRILGPGSKCFGTLSDLWGLQGGNEVI